MFLLRASFTAMAPVRDRSVLIGLAGAAQLQFGGSRIMGWERNWNPYLLHGGVGRLLFEVGLPVLAVSAGSGRRTVA